VARVIFISFTALLSPTSSSRIHLMFVSSSRRLHPHFVHRHCLIFTVISSPSTVFAHRLSLQFHSLLFRIIVAYPTLQGGFFYCWFRIGKICIPIFEQLFVATRYVYIFWCYEKLFKNRNALFPISTLQSTFKRRLIIKVSRM
jgi:hypothetical protein